MKRSGQNILRKRHEKLRREENDSLSSFFKSSGIATGIVVSGSLLIITAMSGFLLTFDDPSAYTVPVACVLLIFASACVGFIGYKLCKDSPVFSGMLSGAFLEAVILIGAIILKGNGAALSPWTRAIIYTVLIPISICGAVLSSKNFSKKRRRSARKR